MPRRPFHRRREQGAQRGRTLFLEASERPVDAGDVVGNQPLERRHMGVPQRHRGVFRTLALIHADAFGQSANRYSLIASSPITFSFLPAPWV